VTEPDQQFDELADLYLRRDHRGDSLFEVWERGHARSDSVTPSTYCSAYRRWICDKIIRHLNDGPESGLLSLGCGNAIVESEVAAKGYRVLAVDALAEAVALATAKGVPAVRADITSWSPTDRWSVIYLDGVLCHLYGRTGGLVPILNRIRNWLTESGVLIASNDSTENGLAAFPAPGLNGVYWLSGEYQRSQALAAGFHEVTVESFEYRRPVSGRRLRAVIVARATHEHGAPKPAHLHP
jgi:SAM-dependent methyltransferase